MKQRTIRICVLLALLAGCATPSLRPPPAPVEAGPATVPPAPAISAQARDDWYLQARSAGKTVWRIDPKRSLIAVTVRRAGSMARLGHDHVVASHDIEGFVAPDDGRADFRFRLDTLTVDEADLRAFARLDTQPSGEAIEGTRHNMLTRVLDADHFPLVTLHVERSAPADPAVRLSVTLHGVTRDIDVPVRVETADAGIAVSGEFALRQTDFGVTPMSVLGGAIAVEDKLELRFRIVAEKF